MRFLETGLGARLWALRLVLELVLKLVLRLILRLILRLVLDPRYSDLRYILDIPVKRPYQPVSLSFMLNKPHLGRLG